MEEMKERIQREFYEKFSEVKSAQKKIQSELFCQQIHLNRTGKKA